MICLAIFAPRDLRAIEDPCFATGAKRAHANGELSESAASWTHESNVPRSCADSTACRARIPRKPGRVRRAGEPSYRDLFGLFPEEVDGGASEVVRAQDSRGAAPQELGAA